MTVHCTSIKSMTTRMKKWPSEWKEHKSLGTHSLDRPMRQSGFQRERKMNFLTAKMSSTTPHCQDFCSEKGKTYISKTCRASSAQLVSQRIVIFTIWFVSGTEDTLSSSFQLLFNRTISEVTRRSSSKVLF